ncbi:ABC transporter permease subunit [Dactylosporangium sp. NPDC005572]|uniref:ABC transporter permease subunit n=1 Tax=Dactylosporangium sp. NPDC005572 TaxID=3156889 RepID=UPI0033A55138
MSWVTWRQHRAELLAAVVLLLALAVPLVWTGLALHAQYRADGVAACVADPGSRAGCERLVEAFADRHATWARRLLWAAFLPALAGVFVGAPLLAREFEQGTWRLACTQGVSRTRWLTTKLTLVGAAVAVLTAAAAGLLSWWRAPLDDISGRLHATSFVIAVPSLTAAAVFAFAVGVTAGAVLRRTIAAMAATLGVFLAARLSLEEFARPHYLTPLARIAEPGAAPPPGTDWSVSERWIDRAGRLVPEGEQSTALRQLAASDGSVDRYLIDHGLRHYTEFQPESRFWAFQAIESAVFLGLAAVLLVAAVRLTRRRT